MESTVPEFTLVEARVLPVSGNVAQNALVFGDADNDAAHDNELVIGTLNGELLVYKGTEILCSATDLGSVCTSLHTTLTPCPCTLTPAAGNTDNLGVRGGHSRRGAQLCGCDRGRGPVPRV